MIGHTGTRLATTSIRQTAACCGNVATLRVFGTTATQTALTGRACTRALISQAGQITIDLFTGIDFAGACGRFTATATGILTVTTGTTLSFIHRRSLLGSITVISAWQ
jgi:hypothetical protein